MKGLSSFLLPITASRTFALRAILATTLLTSAFSLPAQDNRTETSNFQNACDALSEKRYSDAYEYLQKEINADPGNGYAYCLTAILNYQTGQYQNTVLDATKAIEHLPSSDKTNTAKTYYFRALAHEALGHKESALKDYSSSIDLCPKETAFLLARGKFYFSIENYDKSDTDYRRVLALDSESITAMLGLGRNNVGRRLYKEAINYFTRIANNYPDASEPYAYRAEAFLLNEDFPAAIEDIVLALEIDDNPMATNLLYQCASLHFDETLATINSRIKTGNTSGKWLFYNGVVNFNAGNYDDSITGFNKALAISENASAAAYLSDCYLAKLNYTESLSYIDNAIGLDPDNPSYKNKKAMIYWYAGDLMNAILSETMAIDDIDYHHYYYYRRGWYKELSGDLNGALEDYTQSISLYSYYPYSLMSRGRVYLKLGYTGKGNTDLEQCIDLNNELGENNCAQYAYFYLGNRQKAKDYMQSILAHSSSAGNLYDAACLYSLLSEIDSSLQYLDKSLASGYNNFTHIQNDPDLTNLRADSRYKSLLHRYCNAIVPDETSNDIDVPDKVEAENKAYDNKTKEQYVYYEIPFTPAYGIRKVSGQLNGKNISLSFLNAATNVRISSFEASYLLANGFIKMSDINYNGKTVKSSEIPVGAIIMLESLTVGNYTKENVEAVVVSNDNPAITFGKTFLGGTVTLGSNYIKVKTTQNN